MIGRVDASLEATELPFAPVGVARHLEPQPVRFVHNRHHLFFGQRRTIHERAIRLEHAVLVADEVLCRVDLHPVDAVQLRFAHGRARQPWGVRVLALGEAILKPFEERRIRRGRALIERLPDDLHARPEQHCRD